MSELTGGKFANGAVTGAFIQMFNEEAGRFLKMSQSKWKFNKAGRYKTWLVNGSDTNNQSSFEYYTNTHPAGVVFNTMVCGAVMNADGIGLVLSVGAFFVEGPLGWTLAGAGVMINVAQGDTVGVGTSLMSMKYL